MQLATISSSFAGTHDSKLHEYVSFLESSIRANPSSADLHTMLGIAYTALGDVCRALEALRVAIALDANHFFAHLRYADLLHRLSAPGDALLISRRALLLARGCAQWRMAKEQMTRIQEAQKSPLLHPPLADPGWTFLLAVLALLATFAPLLS